MDRQGIITEDGLRTFREQGNVSGSLAMHVHLGEGAVRIDLSIVDETGTVLAIWDGVDVIDDSRVTWCFSDGGSLRISMDPVILDA